MKTLISRLAVSLGIMGAFALPAVVAQPAQAAVVDVFQSCKSAGAAGDNICKDQKDQKLFGPNSIWTRIINTIIFLIGSVAVIMIIIGGLRYVLSGGDSSAVNGAKNTILYAVVGLVITVMSYAIVNFVLSRI